MTTGAVVSLLLAVAAAAWIFAPLLRRDAAEAERIGAVISEERDLASRREMLLGTLKDLEDDRQTGKVDDADYRRMHDELTGDAVAVMRQLDAIDEARSTAGPVGLPSEKPAPDAGS